MAEDKGNEASRREATTNGWEKWAVWYERNWRPVMQWMSENCGASAGQTALDLACGTGQPGFDVARRVGAAGKLIAVDNSADMLGSAERLARAAAIDNIEFRMLDMHDLAGIADASIEAATCGFALMFSPEPGKVLRELHRVLKPRARLALSVWTEPARNPWITSVFGALAQVVPQPAVDPRAPGVFRLAAPVEMEALLRDAGFDEVGVTALEMVLEARSRDEYWQIMLDMAGPLRRAVSGLSAADAARVRDHLFEALGPNEPVRVRAAPLVATGCK
jgi:SAM-dependent methyltransferase